METNTLSALRDQLQRERGNLVLEPVAEMTQQRLSEVDAALARIDAGEYAYCEKCGREISEARLRAEPTVLCVTCAEERAERQATALPEEENIIVPVTGELPPDLEILDDQELAGYLEELVREDGRIDMHELQISTQKGVVYLEGALPSEPERPNSPKPYDRRRRNPGDR
jgi:RNA polymerase-binding transcription factor DksA